jgi:protein SCO1/2
LSEFFKGKPVVLSLVYYSCPMLCTQVLNGELGAFRQVSFNIGEQYEVVTVSFDPKETPELAAAKKQTYVKGYNRAGGEAGWHFLTGDEANIKRLTEAVGFRYAWDEQTKQFAHASGIMLLTPQGKIARYFYGIEYRPGDLRLGLVEASQDKIGTPVDALMLYCYHYDPATGKYGAVVMNIMRLAGVVTVFLIAGMLLVLRRRSAKLTKLTADTNVTNVA